MAHFIMVDDALPATLNYGFVGSTSSTLSTYTSTAVSIGPASADRYVIAAIMCNTATTISSVTIGGVSATQAVATGGTALYIALVPTGTTAVFVVNFSSSVSGLAVVKYYGTALRSLTPRDMASDASVATVHNLDCDTRAGGIVVVGAISTAATTTFVGATQNINFAVGFPSPDSYAAASDLTAASESPRTISVTWNAIGTMRSVAASFR